MPVSKLKTLKIRVDHLLLGVGAVVVLVGALLGWRALRIKTERAELDEGLEQLRKKPGAKGDAPPRFVRSYHASASEPDEGGEGVRVFTPPPQRDPGDLGPSEAVDNFKQVLSELEAVVDSGRVLSEREEAEFYNRATGSFTALSAWIDGADPNERALMEDAYLQMKSLMRELEIQPPRNDPDKPRDPL